jgi:DNA-binding CsgD family transcriptional regulator
MTTLLSTEAHRVLELGATGLTTPEIADRLDMSVAQVRQYWRDAINAMDAKSRLDAVVKAIQQGLIDFPP